MSSVARASFRIATGPTGPMGNMVAIWVGGAHAMTPFWFGLWGQGDFSQGALAHTLLLFCGLDVME